jgi:uncharacterized protein YbcI
MSTELAASPAVDERAEGENGNGSALLQLSNAMVRLYKVVFGRGPTKARAHFAGPDTLVVVLEDSLTMVERKLAELGEHGRLRDARFHLHHGLQDEFRAIVERALGRRTIAFVTGIDTEHDVSVNVFTLEPQACAASSSTDGKCVLTGE